MYVSLDCLACVSTRMLSKMWLTRSSDMYTFFFALLCRWMGPAGWDTAAARKDRLYNEFTRADYISSALWASQAA